MSNYILVVYTLVSHTQDLISKAARKGQFQIIYRTAFNPELCGIMQTSLGHLTLSVSCVSSCGNWAGLYVSRIMFGIHLRSSNSNYVGKHSRTENWSNVLLQAGLVPGAVLPKVFGSLLKLRQ